MRLLRTNTAVIISVGPFYDKTDGVTIEGALTITNERITMTADTDDGAAPTNILDNVTGATSGTANDLNYITGNDAGMMQLELSAANTNRLGRMFLSITDAANHVPVFHEFMVLPQAIYDWMVAGTVVPLPGNVTTWNGTAVATPTVAGVPEVDLTHVAGATANVAALATNVDAILTDTSVIGAAGAGLTAVPWNASWDAEVQSEVDDALVAQRLDELLNADSDLDGLAPPTVGSVVHELLTKSAAGFTYDQTTDSLEAIRDNMGTAQTGDSFARIGATGSGLTSLATQASVDAVDNFIDTEIASIISTLGTPAGSSVSADVAAVSVLVDDLEARMGVPSNLGSGATLSANLVDIEGQTDDIGAAGAGLTAMPAGTLTAGERTSIAAALKALVVETEGSYTVGQLLSLALAALAGVTSDAGATLKTPNGVATRIAATVNASNERTAMTLTPSA